MRKITIMLLSAIIGAFLLVQCKESTTSKEPEKKDEIQPAAIRISRPPLPYPPGVDTAAGTAALLSQRDSLTLAGERLSRESAGAADNTAALDELNHLMGMNTAAIVMHRFETICGPKDDSQPVELYDGSLGVTKQFVDKNTTPVGQLQWRYSFGSQFAGPGDNAGNVMGARWCTGTLIAKNIFITAGHCFDNDEAGSGWVFPRKKGQIISSSEIAKLMKVNFNYQTDRTTGKIRTDTIDYPVDSLIEYRNGGLDYAVIILGKDKNGRFPGERFGVLPVAAKRPAVNEKIVIIQHPLGNPKVVEAGKISAAGNRHIEYNDVDTQGGSSGSAVISGAGKIVGVHVEGGCRFDGKGANKAVPIYLIIPRSPLVKKLAQ